MKNIHIENSYTVWDTVEMSYQIRVTCLKDYYTRNVEIILNRSMRGMYIEWYLHNIGYYLTLPFIKNNTIKKLNNRFKHLDLEEHRK